MSIVNTDSKIVVQSIRQRIVSNFSWTAINAVVGRLAAFIANIYLARVLEAKGFGLFTLAITVTSFFWLAVDLGTNMYGIREISKDKENATDIINTLLSLRITGGVIMFGFYTLGLFSLDIQLANKPVFIGSALYLLTYSLFSDWVFRGLEQFKYIAYGNFYSSIAFLITVFVFIHGKEDVLAASVVWSLSFISSGIYFTYVIKKKLNVKLRFSFEVGKWLHHIKESIYFAISGALLSLHRSIPTIMLATFFSTREVGIFSAPHKLILQIVGLGYLLPNALYPIFSEVYLSNKKKFNEIHKILQIIMLASGIPIALIGTLFAEFLVPLILGHDYQDSIAIFKVLVWLIPFTLMRFTYGTVLLATGFQRYHNLSSIIAVVSMVAIGMFLLPKFGIIGLTYAVVSAEALLLIAMAILSEFTFKKEIKKAIV